MSRQVHFRVSQKWLDDIKLLMKKKRYRSIADCIRMEMGLIVNSFYNDKQFEIEKIIEKLDEFQEETLDRLKIIQTDTKEPRIINEREIILDLVNYIKNDIFNSFERPNSLLQLVELLPKMIWREDEILLTAILQLKRQNICSIRGDFIIWSVIDES